MPTTTTNLGLNKTDTTSDGQGSFVDKNEYFNFDTDLNDNWDKIDSAVGKLSDLETTEQSNLVGAINEVKNNINIIGILETIYPVGSVYLSTSSTCPLSSIFGTWTKKATSIITSVNSTGSVVGNGKSLGFTDGSQNFGITFTTAFANAMTASAYNKDVGTSASYAALINTAKAIGVVTSASESGLVANITSGNIPVNIFERTA